LSGNHQLQQQPIYACCTPRWSCVNWNWKLKQIKTKGQLQLQLLTALTANIAKALYYFRTTDEMKQNPRLSSVKQCHRHHTDYTAHSL